MGNADYDMAKTGVLAGDLRIPAPVFLLATVDAGLLPRQSIEALLERPTVDPPPPKQPVYVLTERFLIWHTPSKFRRQRGITVCAVKIRS